MLETPRARLMGGGATAPCRCAAAPAAPRSRFLRGCAGRRAGGGSPASRSSRRSTTRRPTSCGRCSSRSAARRFGDWELCLVDDASTEPRVRDDARGGRSARTRASASRAASATAASSPPPTTRWRWPRGEFVALLDHDDELHPDALADVDEALDARPRGRLRLHRRGQDRPQRPPLRAVLQAGLVAGADADPDVHLPPQRAAPRPGRGGRRLRRRVRGLPGLGPGAQGDRAGARGRARAAGPLPLARCSRPRPRAAARRAKPWAFEAGTAGGPGPLRAHRPAGRVERDAERPGVYHLEPALERPSRWSASSSRPTARRARSATRRWCWSSTACAASSRTSTYANYEIVVRRRRPTTPAVLDELQAIARRSAAASSTSTGRSTSRRRSTLGAAAQRGRAPAAAQRRHRGRRRRTGSSAW